jgi:hypothetical protein
MTDLYYLQDDRGAVTGPFRADQLRQMADAEQLSRSWQVSTDRQHWVPADDVGGLFADEDPHRTRAKRRAEMTALFLEHFVFENENYRTSFPWVKSARARWAELTLPRQFVLARATEAGWEHVRYDLTTGEQFSADPKEVDRGISDAVRRFPWFTLLVGLLGLVWFVSVLRHFTLASAVVKALVLAAPAVAASVLRTRGRLFVGYVFDREARSRMQAVRNAFLCLRHSSKVWLCELQGHVGSADWKFPAGRLPVPVFGRPVPNVATNVRVLGFAARDKAVYFLPEKILVIDGGQVRFVEYLGCTIATGHLVYPELGDQVYPDAEVAGKRFRHVNADGGPDPRFPDNPQVPLLRFGRLRLEMGTTRVELLTTNPRVPELFKEQFFSTPAVTTFSPAHGAPPVGEPAAVVALPDYGDPGGGFWQRLGERAWPVLRALKNNVPARAWLAVAALAALAIAVGALVSLFGAGDRDVERANRLYDEGKRAEAVALYARHPDRFWRPGGTEVRNLRRIIEFELVDRDDRVEARAWIEKALEHDVPLAFNNTAAAGLYAKVKDERERRRAQEAEEGAAHERALKEEEERKRQDREAEEEFQRQASEAREKREKEAKEKEARRREEEEIQRTLEAAKKRAREEEERQRAEAEKMAAPILREAHKLLDDGRKEKAIERLREIVRKYPGTPSAAEAEKLLGTLGGQ